MFVDALLASDATMNIGEFVKIVQQNKINTGEIRFFAWLRENKFLRYEGKDNVPADEVKEMGLFIVKKRETKHRTMYTTKLNGKGMLYFFESYAPQDGTQEH